MDYQWYQRLTDSGVFFVTRLRQDAHYRVLEQCPIPRNRHILKDEIISLGSHHYRQAARFRRVEVWIEERQEVLVLLSNHSSFGSSTIAQIYRERWRIEVFFRYLKQNLRIKTFVGTSANALHIQIWTALHSRSNFAKIILNTSSYLWKGVLSKAGQNYSCIDSEFTVRNETRSVEMLRGCATELK